MFVRLKAKSYHFIKIGMCEIFISLVKRQCLRIDITYSGDKNSTRPLVITSEI